MANLIVLEATKDAVRFSFLEYFKVGLPVTIITLSIGVALIR